MDQITDEAAAAAWLLKRYGPTEAARRAGASIRAVERWATGERTPRAQAAAGLTAAVSEARAAAKGKPTPPDASPPVLEPPTTTTYDPRAQALRVVQAVGDELAAARGNENYTPGERAALANSATTALRLYSRLCGSLDVSESQITKSAPWGRILGAFHRVFARHPEATKALEEFIADLRERGE